MKIKLFLSWCIIIMIVMGIPGNYFPKSHSFIDVIAPDKILHLFFFSILGYLTALNLEDRWKKKRVIFLIGINIIFGTVYGALTELLQLYLFIGRDGNYYDLLADIVGIIIGIFIFYRFKTRIEKINKRMFLEKKKVKN